MENPIKIDDLGVPIFEETTICICWAPRGFVKLLFIFHCYEPQKGLYPPKGIDPISEPVHLLCAFDYSPPWTTTTPWNKSLLNPCSNWGISPGAPAADTDRPEVVACRRSGVAHGMDNGGGGPQRLGGTEGGGSEDRWRMGFMMLNLWGIHGEWPLK